MPLQAESGSPTSSNSTYVVGKGVEIMKPYSPPDTVSQQTGVDSRTGSRETSTPISNSKLAGGLQSHSAGSGSGGRGSGRGRGRGRGGKVGRGSNSQSVQQHIPYHNMGSYAGYPAAAGTLYGQQQGRAQPGALAPEPCNHQQYSQFGQMQQHNKALGAQQPYMHSQRPAPPLVTNMCQLPSQQQQQMDTDLVLSPTGLQMPSTGLSAAAAPSSGALQLRSNSLQLPGAPALPGLFSPTTNPLEVGRISNMGLDRSFSFEMAGLQGMQPWIPENSLMDNGLAGDLQPAVDTGLDTIGRHGYNTVPSSHKQQPAAQAPSVGQMQPGMQQVAQQVHRQAGPYQQYQGQPMQQAAAGYSHSSQQSQGRMLPPPALGSQYMWHQQQVQQMQQVHYRQPQHHHHLQQVHRQPAGHQARQHPQRSLAAISNSVPPSLQQQQQNMYPYSNAAYPVGAFNMGISSHPSVGCNDVVPPPPSSSSGHYSQVAGHAAAMPHSQAAVVAAGSSMYRAAAPPPITLPYASSGAAQRPRRSTQGYNNTGHSNSGGVGYSQPGQHAGHNAAGILSELEAIKGPAMQGLMDVHIVNQQQRISVSALLDAGPFGMTGRRLSQGLDPLSVPHQRLSLYGLGSDTLDILGIDGLDLDTFLGTSTGGALHGSSGDMVAPVAPGSRTTVKVQGEANAQWQAAPAAFTAFAGVSGPPMTTAPGLPSQHAAAPAPAQAQRRAGPSAAVTHGMLSPHARGSCTGEIAAGGQGIGTAAAGCRGIGANASGGVAMQSLKRKRGSSSNLAHGMGLDLGAVVKQQRVSGLLMELDTPKVRALAGPLLSPRPNNTPAGSVAAALATAAAIAAAGRQQSGAADATGEGTQQGSGRPVSAKHRVVLDLRSPASQQREQQQQVGDDAPVEANTSTVPATAAMPPPAFFGQHHLSQQQDQHQQLAGTAVPAPCAPARVLNLADERSMPATVVTASPLPAQPMPTATLSGPVGALGAAVNGMGCVAQITVGKHGSKGFLPAMHEIERMI